MVAPDYYASTPLRQLVFDPSDGSLLHCELLARFNELNEVLRAAGGEAKRGAVSVLDLLSEEEELEVLRRLRDQVGSAVRLLLGDALEQLVRELRRREASTGAPTGPTCPRVFARVKDLVGKRKKGSARQLWETFDADGMEVYVGSDGRLHEDGGGSVSYRTFCRYVTDARKLLRTN